MERFMIPVGNVVVSEDIEDQYFVCDLIKCKGECCVEGDAGAPLEENELEVLEEIYPAVEPYLMPEAKEVIKKKGMYEKDWEGEYVTTTVENRECVFAFYEDGICKCGIEKAYNEGKTDFLKPVSCHLYPARIQKFRNFHAVNYDRWEICSPACSNGKSLGVPLYKFLKDPFIRKFGKEWYDELVDKIENKDEPPENTYGKK